MEYSTQRDQKLNQRKAEIIRQYLIENPNKSPSEIREDLTRRGYKITIEEITAALFFTKQPKKL